MYITENDCLFDNQLGQRSLSASRPQSHNTSIDDENYNPDEAFEDISEIDDNDSEFCDDQDLEELTALSIADLKDFSDSISVNLEKSPYVRISGKDGEPKIVKKSTVVWFLENNVQKPDRISSDRTLRVRQLNCPAPSNQLVLEVGKKNVMAGDWCVFRKASEDGFLVGRVLLLSYLDNRKERILEWKFSLEKAATAAAAHIGALCDWFTLDMTTGSLGVVQMETHGFHPLIYYVCSLPPPQFSVSSDGLELNTVPIDTIKSLINIIPRELKSSQSLHFVYLMHPD